MMNPQTTLFRHVAMAMAVVFSLAVLPVSSASAGMVATDTIVEQGDAADARATVDAFLARDDVRNELQALGVDPAEARARVSALSDAEAVNLAQEIDGMPAGQGAVGTIVGAALIVFLVLLITDILGFTSVFGFTQKGSANPG